MRGVLASILVTIVGLIAPDARAASFFASYEVTESSYAFLWPFDPLPAPPPFEVTGGDLMIVFGEFEEHHGEHPPPGELPIVDGPVGLDARFTVDFGTGLGPDYDLSGTIDIDFRHAVGTVVGNTLQVTIETLAVVGEICSGVCNPISDRVSVFLHDIELTGTLDPLDFPSTFRATLPLDLTAIRDRLDGMPISGLPFDLNIVAHETWRDLPEPGSGGLLLLGAAALAWRARSPAA
jgi:hypothetical protein